MASASVASAGARFVANVNTSFDDLFLPLAVQMMDDFGKDVLITRLIPGDYDPTTGQQGTIPRTFPWKIGFGKTGGVRGGKYNADSEDGDTIASARYVYCAAFGIPFAPQPNDQLIMDPDTSVARTFEITSVDPTYSGQQIVLYSLFLVSA